MLLCPSMELTVSMGTPLERKAVNAAIKAILKTDVLNDYEACRYIQLENGLYLRCLYACVSQHGTDRFDGYAVGEEHRRGGRVAALMPCNMLGDTATLGTRSFLTKDEIRLLMEGKLKNAKQELYRDLYLFCAFTGLSFAD